MKEVIKAEKYRCYPNKDQLQVFKDTFGSARFVWNKRVERFNSYTNCGPNLPDETIKELKLQYDFLKNVPYNALEQKLQDWNKTLKQFFNKNRKTKLGKPHFKKKNSKQSFRLNHNGFSVKENGLFLGKRIGRVKIKGSCSVNELQNIKFITVAQECDRYYVTVTYSAFVKPFEKTNNKVGLDLGLTHFLTDNLGNKIDNPRYLQKSEHNLKTQQKHLSRKVKGSKNYEKCKAKLNNLHYRVRCKRSHFNHIVSNSIIKNFDIICIEDLQVKNMIKNRKLSKAISSASWYQFTNFLSYKCDWYDKTIIKVDKFYPSSKTCSACGNVAKQLPLDIRKWMCTSCNTEHDRDVNAAKNILKEGMKLHQKVVL